jgi:hypothetical protein
MSEKKPETPAEWAAYRCQASCKLGRDMLEGIGHGQDGVGSLDHAFHALLHAVEDLSKQVAELMKP